jgi:hypothetical protein
MVEPFIAKFFNKQLESDLSFDWGEFQLKNITLFKEIPNVKVFMIRNQFKIKEKN